MREPFARDSERGNAASRNFASVAAKVTPKNNLQSESKPTHMKTITTPSVLRTFALAATLAALPFAAQASEKSADSAARILAANGAVVIENAGPYVERGTPRVQVSVKLGRPNLELADGTWLYHNRAVEGSAARGTLVVRFDQGRVTDLVSVAPAVVAALRADPRKALPAELVASK